MEVTRILAEIDAQIAKLQQVKVFLGGTPTAAPSPAAPSLVVKRPVGRPRKFPLPLGAPTAPATTAKKAGKRALSPDARKRIAEAQKRRWAASRKSA